MEDKKYILFETDPFCFGPISTTSSLVAWLRDNTRLAEKYAFVLLTTQTGVQLGRASGVFDQIIDCNTIDHGDLIKHEQLIAGAHAYIGNTNPTPLEIVYKTGVPVFFIDLLFWMWDELRVDRSPTVMTYIQDFHGSGDKIERFSSRMKNFMVVDPLLHPALFEPLAPGEEPRGILFSFGGIDTVYCKTLPFYEALVERVFASKIVECGEDVLIIGGGKTIERIRDKFGGLRSNVRIDSIGKMEFIKEVRQRRKLITNAGLVTYHECRAAGKDVFFLPPQNYSAYHQLNTILRENPEARGFPLTVEYGYPVVPVDMPELEGVDAVQSATRRFMETPGEFERLLGALERHVLSREVTTKWSSATPIVSGIEAIGRHLEHELMADRKHVV